MAPPSAQAQHQRHAIQLLSRVLNLRPNASPFTLILDSLNQRASPLVNEIVLRALSHSTQIILVSHESTRIHPLIHQIPTYTAANENPTTLLTAIESALQQSTSKQPQNPNGNQSQNLLIIDSLSDLTIPIPTLFHLVAIKHACPILGIYHTDVLPPPSSPYAPSPLATLSFTATTILTLHSPAHILAENYARSRSLELPVHGLLTAAEGIVEALDAHDPRGVVVNAEFRRKSGRPESYTYFLRPGRDEDYNPVVPGMPMAPRGSLKREFVVLLDMVPAFNTDAAAAAATANTETEGKDENDLSSTFNLNLTAKQKAAREEVVLPYFDAQKGEGGEGGRILYDMGEEDDFDEEEDEI